MKTSPKKDGGPFHPTGIERFDGPQRTVEHFPGLSVRQAYKIAALQGELASQSEESGHYVSFETLAIKCADIANAMLAEDEEWEKKQK